LSEKVDNFARFFNGDNKDYAPVSPIELKLRFSSKVIRFTMFFKGDRREDTPVSPIELPSRSRERLERLMQQLLLLFKKDKRNGA